MHRKRSAVLIAVGVAAFFLGVRTLLASNMGFVVNCPLPAAGPASRSGTNPVNLPYQRDAQLLRASDLLRDLQISNVRDTQRFLESSDALFVYTGRKGSFTGEETLGHPSDFPLVPGDCYFVRMLSKIDYVVGGSSDPAVALALDAAGPSSKSGTNFIALPSHITARTAGQLMQDIGLANVASVQRYLTETDSLEVYTGRKGSPPDFPLDPCQCYFIKMNTSVSYIPSHY